VVLRLVNVPDDGVSQERIIRDQALRGFYIELR
jgi:hypothetical protein